MRRKIPVGEGTEVVSQKRGRGRKKMDILMHKFKK
jgi:hypothetical protein